MMGTNNTVLYGGCENGKDFIDATIQLDIANVTKGSILKVAGAQSHRNEYFKVDLSNVEVFGEDDPVEFPCTPSPNDGCLKCKKPADRTSETDKCETCNPPWSIDDGECILKQTCIDMTLDCMEQLFYQTTNDPERRAEICDVMGTVIDGCEDMCDRGIP